MSDLDPWCTEHQQHVRSVSADQAAPNRTTLARIEAVLDEHVGWQMHRGLMANDLLAVFAAVLTEAREDVARATAQPLFDEDGGDWASASPELQEHFRRQADAALAVIAARLGVTL